MREETEKSGELTDEEAEKAAGGTVPNTRTQTVTCPKCHTVYQITISFDGKGTSNVSCPTCLFNPFERNRSNR